MRGKRSNTGEGEVGKPARLGDDEQQHNDALRQALDTPGPEDSSNSESEPSETSPYDEPTMMKTRYRPQDIIFTFGPNNSYFLSASLSSYRYSASTPVVDALNTLNISRPIAVALTPHRGFLSVYELTDGAWRICLSTAGRDTLIKASEAEDWVEAHRGYQKMYDLLSKGEGQGRDVSISIGPRGRSWFARKGKQVIHEALPADLEQKITAKKAEGAYPWQVTLGTHGSWVAIWSDETWSWHLSGYGDLAKYFQEDEMPHTVVLSPFDDANWLLVQDNGYVLWNLTGDAKESNIIARQMRAYMQRRATKDDETFSTNSHGRNIRITPETHYGEEEEGKDWYTLATSLLNPSKHAHLMPSFPSFRSASTWAQSQLSQHPILFATCGAIGILALNALGFPAVRRQIARLGRQTAMAVPLSMKRALGQPRFALGAVATGAAVFGAGYVSYKLGRLDARREAAELKWKSEG